MCGHTRMKIDRDVFRLLVSTLAGTAAVAPACTPRPAEGPGAEPREIVAIPAQPASPPPSPPPLAPPPPAPAPPPSAAPDAPRTTMVAPNPYQGTPIHADACAPSLNKVGAAPACSLRAPGPTCESFQDTVSECPTMSQLLQPRVAAAAIACLNRKSGTEEICTFNVSSICAYEALTSACLDPGARAPCQRVMAKCGAPNGRYRKMTAEACEAGWSGVATGKRQKFISCITETCRFETCLTYM